MEEDIDKEQISEDEILERLSEAIQGNVQPSDQKNNVFEFLNAVATAKDTTKTGYLRDDKDLNEVGIPKYPVRTFHSLALISDKIMGNDYFKEFFEKEAEIITKTSLSRNAKLLSLAVLQKREVADVSRKPIIKNKGWFKPKQEIVERGE